MRYNQVPIAILLLAWVVLSGCETPAPSKVPDTVPLEELTHEQLRREMEFGRYNDVAQALDALMRESPEHWSGEFESLQGRVKDALLGRYRQLEFDGEPDEQLFSFIDLASLELVDGYPEDHRHKLTLRVADSLLNKDFAISSLTLVESLLEERILKEDELLKWGRVAVAEGYYTLVEHIAELLDEYGSHAAEELWAEVDRDWDAARLMGGTVTILVDRGIKLEDGIGYADRAIGSGFFIDRRGYLITNYHVIASEVDPQYEGYSRLFIRTPGSIHGKIPATVIGWDPVFDIALVKTAYVPSHVFSLERAPNYDVGARIVAIGSPGGLEQTMTSGIISATERPFLEMGNSIQVDLPINSGNSGGPLLDENNRLIGVVFAGIEQFEGVNFAIPSSWIFRLLHRLYEGGRVALPWFGVNLYENGREVEVNYVFPGSPAFRVGVRRGDILKAVGKVDVSSVSDAHSALLDYRPGRLISIHWARDGERQRGIVKLETRPENPLEQALELDVVEGWSIPFFGMVLRSIGKRDYTIDKLYSGMIGDETGFSKDDPLRIYRWSYSSEAELLQLQLRVRKRKVGFIENSIRLVAFSRVNTLL